MPNTHYPTDPAAARFRRKAVAVLDTLQQFCDDEQCLAIEQGTWRGPSNQDMKAILRVRDYMLSRGYMAEA